jgi:tetratricopeptide (TPR) repeat protein
MNGTEKTILLIAAGLAMTMLALPLVCQQDVKANEGRLVERFKRANPLFLDGNAQLNKGNLEKAEKKFLEALEIMPEHADAACNLAQLELKRRNFPKALEWIALAKTNYPLVANFQALSHGRNQDSLRLQLRQLEEQRVRVQGELAGLASDANQEQRTALENTLQSTVQAMQQLEAQMKAPASSTTDVPADYFFIHGNIFFQQGNFEEASSQYREAIRLEPLHGNAYNNLALVSYSRGRYDEALVCLRSAEAAGIRVNPDFKKAVESKLSRR